MANRARGSKQRRKASVWVGMGAGGCNCSKCQWKDHLAYWKEQGGTDVCVDCGSHEPCFVGRPTDIHLHDWDGNPLFEEDGSPVLRTGGVVPLEGYEGSHDGGRCYCCWYNRIGPEQEPRQPGPEQAPQAVYERLLAGLQFDERDLSWMHRLLGERLVEFDAFPMELVVRGDESHVSLTREVVAAPKPEPFPPMYGPEERRGWVTGDGFGAGGTVRYLTSAYPGETVEVLD